MIQAPTNSTGDDPQDDTPLSFEVWLVRYWYILLIILAVLVVLIVLVCACVFRRHSQATFQQQHRLNNSNNISDKKSSSQQGSFPIIPSLSSNSTPVQSPHSPHSSAQMQDSLSRRSYMQSMSPGLVMASNVDHIRSEAHSASSNSSSNSVMRGKRNTILPSGQPTLDKGSYKVTYSGSLKTAPSTMSVESSSSGKSGVSYCFQPSSESNAVVEVGVTVHTPGDPDKAVTIATAAALAESARQLAEEAANFIDYEPQLVNGKMNGGVCRTTSSYPTAQDTCTDLENHYMIDSASRMNNNGIDHMNCHSPHLSITKLKHAPPCCCHSLSLSQPTTSYQMNSGCLEHEYRTTVEHCDCPSSYNFNPIPDVVSRESKSRPYNRLFIQKISANSKHDAHSVNETPIEVPVVNNHVTCTSHHMLAQRRIKDECLVCHCGNEGCTYACHTCKSFVHHVSNHQRRGHENETTMSQHYLNNSRLPFEELDVSHHSYRLLPLTSFDQNSNITVDV